MAKRKQRADRPGPLVVVYWHDIYATAGWSDSWKPKPKLADCVEVGWLVCKNADHVVLVRGLAEPGTEDQHAGATVTIPASVVTRIVTVEEPG